MRGALPEDEPELEPLELDDPPLLLPDEPLPDPPYEALDDGDGSDVRPVLVGRCVYPRPFTTRPCG